jgi:hypothetical protein
MRTAVLLACLFLLTVFDPAPAVAQEPTGPRPVQPARRLTLPAFRPPVADSGIFSPLPWPAANEIRRATGAPGRGYWQQRVDYTIRATLDTAAKRLNGTESIRYTNNSPDTLRFLWMQLDQNLFRPGSTGSLLFDPSSRFGGGGFKGGFEIDQVMQCTGTAGQRRGAAVTSPRKRRTARPSAPPPPCPSIAQKTRVDQTLSLINISEPTRK